ncbi:alcohol dehydrogenase family protein [Marinomonas flavescens]|uniref:alcohol dehydrogenase family protein n=1 Tax=Marinomonas flavescens TaxID=2529379 RepID=UPI001A9E1CE1|nr:alcohol dehydrogenase family protein [Marinomonas flavescens]
MTSTIPSSIPDTMSGIVLTGHGDTDKLHYRDDLPIPILSNQDVLIRVAAAGVNNTDLNTRLAWYSKKEADSTDASWSGQALSFPLIQGADVCGIIVAVGSKVNPKRIGERVLIEPCLQEANGETLNPPGYFGSECNGGFAQYTKVADRHAYAIQSDLSDSELASFPCSYSTAENMLSRANVCAQDRVLISGASGGVGSAAVQLAKARGAHVIAITSASKRQALTDIGADQVVTREDDLVSVLGENSVDVVIDLVAGEQWPTFLQVLSPGGRYAVSGAIGGAFVELDVRTLYLKDLSLFGCTVLAPNVFQNLIHYLEQGKIKPLVAKTYSLKEIVQAQEAFQKKNHLGKIVLTVATR